MNSNRFRVLSEVLMVVFMGLSCQLPVAGQDPVASRAKAPDAESLARQASARQLREQAQGHFKAGNYAKMVEAYGELARRGDAGIEDRLWQGHAWQLAGDWRKAVASYEIALSDIEHEAAKTEDDMKNPKPPAPEPGGFERPGLSGKRPSPESYLESLKRKSAGLTGQRVLLGLAIARIERIELKDPKAAAAVLTRLVELLNHDLGMSKYVRLDVLKELAIAQQEANDPQAALATWGRLLQICQEDPKRPYSYGGHIDMSRVAQLLGQAGAGKALPALRYLFVLSPAKPEVTLMLDEEETRLRSYAPSANPDSPHWRYAFAAEPGKELATIEFAVDVEQIRERAGGHFRCFALLPEDPSKSVPLGSIGWPANEPPGREVLRRKIDIPPGLKVVHIETGSWKDWFAIHSVEVKTTFRPVSVAPEPLRPRAGVRLSVRVDTPGGELTCGEKILEPNCDYTDFPPGEYVLSYDNFEVGDNRETKVVFEPGKSYGVFINVASPFKWSQARLSRRIDPLSGRASIAKLADGNYLTVWCERNQDIVLSRSKNLTDWSAPESAPFDTPFDEVSPTVATTKDGTVWVAYFSKRISLFDLGSAGYRLWLTSTRDGKTWAPIRPVQIDSVDGWPLSAPQLIETRQGRCELLWRNYEGSGKGFNDIRELTPIEVEGDNKAANTWRNPHVVEDANGFLHMVFDNSGREIFHATSRDGRKWGKPEVLVEPAPNRFLHNPQLVSGADRFCLLWYQNDGGYLARARFGHPLIGSQEAVRITSHTVDNGCAIVLTDNGQVILLVGGETSWLLRAELEDLLRP